MDSQLIRIAHSPDSDDAFMFYALAHEKIPTPGLRFEHILSDIQTLNQKALEGVYEISAISMHALPLVTDRYALLSSGASMGDGYGPMVVSRKPYAPEEIRKQVVAVPGLLTTAYLALRMYAPEVEVRVMPFDQILPAVASGEVELGLIIHEGQLTYADEALHLVLDLGKWWASRTDGLPLPLGGNVVRRDLGLELCARLSSILRDGIRYSLEHRAEALDYALSFARGMDPKLADRFVGMYVNDLTVDYGARGRAAVERLFDEAHELRLISRKPQLDWI